MEGVALGEIQQWTKSAVVGNLERLRRPSGLSTDSRTLEAGELFCALQGPHFDGHAFVEHAFAQGACAALVEREWGVRHRSGTSGPLLLVPSPLRALGAVARSYRERFEPWVVAVVGSAGKTTAKEMMAAVLEKRYCVLKTRGSENNQIGVPKTLLELSSRHRVVVLELAARKAGDIAYLCSIARPGIGVLLNIGSAHLEFFESVEGVAKAKGELLDYLEDESSLTLVNADDCVVAKEIKRTKGRLLGFGLGRESHYCGEGLVLDREGRGHFSLQNIAFDLQVCGRHNVYNALAAAAVGDVLGVPWEDIRRALAEFRPVSMRSQILRKNGIRVIDDSYNANPDSMRAALDLLAGVEGRRRIAVLGDMLELGSRGAELHAEMGRCAAALGIDIVLAIGPLSLHLVEAARAAGLDEECSRHFEDKDALNACVQSTLRPGDVMLVKASRAVALEEIVHAII